MCRLYGFIANEPTKVDCSLVFAQNALLLQSRADEIGRNHADGWGIVTYSDNNPVLIKNTAPAFSDQHFSTTAEKIYSKTIIAHVRKATVGTPSVLNTHPFSWGKFSFAHNGTVTGFERFSDQLAKETACDIQAERLGQTDSEQYFLWLLSQLRTYGFIDLARLQFNAGKTEQLAVFLKERVVSLNQRCLSAVIDKVPRLNFVLTDGHVLVACRWNNSLHTIRREGIYDCEICGIPHIHHHETVSHRAQAFASEPITNEPWVEIANQSVVLAKL